MTISPARRIVFLLALLIAVPIAQAQVAKAPKVALHGHGKDGVKQYLLSNHVSSVREAFFGSPVMSLSSIPRTAFQYSSFQRKVLGFRMGQIQTELGRVDACSFL